MRISDWSSDVCSSDLFATLTGAARVALGPELPAFFCNDDKLAGVILRQGAAEGDPIWRLPLHKPYGQGLDSKVADLNNISGSPYAGAIVAALFLERFVSPRSEEHTSELQSLMRISYAVFCLKKKNNNPRTNKQTHMFTS